MSEKKLNKKLIIIVSIVAAVVLIATVAVIVLMPQRETVADVLDLGDRYMSELDYESAIREYKRAIEIDPKAEDAYLKLAEAYIALGDIDSAIEALEDGYAATNSERILARLDELRGGNADSGAHSPDDAESIVMASTPQKTTYNVGDMLDLTGLTLTVTYQDGATAVVSDGYTCEVETLDEAGTQEVTVRYGGAETKFTVTVENVAETETVETEPVVTEPPFSVEDLPIAEDFAWTLEDGVLTISGHGRMPDYDFHEAPWFEKSDEIERVVINDGILNIGNNAFWDCDFTSITIPNSVVNIGDSAFYWCDYLTSISIPSSVVNIGKGAFNACMDLSSITIPDSVINIGDRAFGNCFTLTSITISDSVVNIGDGAFGNCQELISINVSEDNPNYRSVGGVLFSKDMTEILGVPAGMTGNYDIPYGVISINSDAFCGCSHLTSITIPDSVVSIGNWAFELCGAFTSITIPSSVVNIGQQAFAFCDALASITIPDSVVNIGERAFESCINLTIHAPAGSAAETYARDNDIPFSPIS